MSVDGNEIYIIHNARRHTRVGKDDLLELLHKEYSTFFPLLLGRAAPHCPPLVSSYCMILSVGK